MSAAATAAGYLYASGRLRGRAAREQGEPERPQQQEKPKPTRREKVRVAVYEPEQKPAQPEQKPAQPEQARRTPKIEYRTRRRWSAA
jgi:hypothetical protein